VLVLKVINLVFYLWLGFALSDKLPLISLWYFDFTPFD